MRRTGRGRAADGSAGPPNGGRQPDGRPQSRSSARTPERAARALGLSAVGELPCERWHLWRLAVPHDTAAKWAGIKAALAGNGSRRSRAKDPGVRGLAAARSASRFGTRKPASMNRRRRSADGGRRACGSMAQRLRGRTARRRRAPGGTVAVAVRRPSAPPCSSGEQPFRQRSRRPLPWLGRVSAMSYREPARPAFRDRVLVIVVAVPVAGRRLGPAALAQLAQQGSVSAEVQPHGAVRFKLRWRQDGGQKVRYLGSDVVIAQAVAAGLRAWQQPLQQRRELKKRLAAAKQLKAVLEPIVADAGLHLHGYAARRRRPGPTGSIPTSPRHGVSNP
jgi:hypothetical protein